MSQKQIAFICHPYHRGGVTRWMAEAAIFYSLQGYLVYFAAPEPTVTFYSARGRESMVELLRKEPSPNLRLITRKVGRLFEFGTEAFRTHVYKQLINEIPVGTPVILSDDECVWDAGCSLHDAYPIVAVLHADDEKYYQLIAKHHTKCDAIVSVSNRVDKVTRERVRDIPVEKLSVIPCGIRLPAKRSNAKRNERLQMLFVGRIENEQKRAGDLVKVAEELKAAGVAFHLKIIGDGVEVKDQMQAEVKRLNLEDSVAFTGWLSLDKVIEQMLSADILLLTSNYEGMPVSMMEALACGCGFTGTRVSGIEDYEQHALASDCFRVFAIGDIADAAMKLKDLGTVDPSKRALAARKLAEQEFSMNTCIERYNDAIGKISRSSFQKGEANIAITAVLKSHLMAISRYIRIAISK